MPIIDVSRSAYRALVITAHQHGMSIDRFIQHRFVEQTHVIDENDVINAGQVVTAEGSATPRGAQSGRAGPQIAAKRTGTGVDRRVGGDSAFETLWRRIELNAGTEMFTRREQSFTYEVEAGYLIVRESGTRVPCSQFRKALAQWPATGPSSLRGITLHRWSGQCLRGFSSERARRRLEPGVPIRIGTWVPLGSSARHARARPLPTWATMRTPRGTPGRLPPTSGNLRA